MCAMFIHRLICTYINLIFGYKIQGNDLAKAARELVQLRVAFLHLMIAQSAKGV